MASIIVHETVNTIADLREFDLTPGSDTVATGSTLHVCGYHEANDDGGGVYYYDSASDLHPNMGTVIAPKSTWAPESDPQWEPGRWLLLHNGTVTVKQFGAIGVRTATPAALDDLDGSGLPFIDTQEIESTYIPYLAGPFSGLDPAADTMDWAAVQMAVLVCTKGVDFNLPNEEVGDLPAVEVPSGVYLCSRPVWLGDDQYYDPGQERGGKQPRQLGFAMLGQRGGTRQQVDFSSANIWLINNRANWYCLSMSHDTESDTYYLKSNLPGTAAGITIALDLENTATEIKTALDSVLAPDYEVALQVSGSVTLRDQNILFTLTGPEDAPLSPDFRGEILAITDDDPLTYADFVHCFPDSAVLSYRRTASLHYRVENISLRGNNGESGQLTQRNGSFGVLYVTTQFFGHYMQNMDIADVDTAVGLLQGTGANGEQTRMDRIHAEPIRRMFYTNAPQAFHQEFFGWNAHVQNIDIEELSNLVFAEFDNADTPGFGAMFYNAGCTFSDNMHVESDGTMVKVRRGTGIVQFIGGRVEHMARLFHYDAVSSQGIENNMDVRFQGIEFTVVGGGERRFVQGSNIDEVAVDDGNGTQYGLFVDGCTFQSIFSEPNPEYGDLIFESLLPDKLRCVFSQCRFLGIRSFQQLTSRAAFRHCYRNDFIQAGANAAPLREFTEEPTGINVRTQSLRTAWQDTPWIQTGPRFNVLGFSDFAGQAYSADATTDVAFNNGGTWELTNDTFTSTETDLGAFGKWGAFEEANLSPSPEAFYLALKANTALSNPIGVVDLTDSGAKVFTYQALVRVTGTLKFALERPDVTGPAINVYDFVVLNTSADVVLVTLRMQVQAEEDTSTLAVRIINNEGSLSAMQVYWQQAWYGREGDSTYPIQGALANAGQVRTPTGDPVSNEYNWAVNALGIKAASRFQLPLLNTATGQDAEGMGWQSAVAAVDYELVDGEMYMDEHMVSTLGRANDKWYQFIQPERVELNAGTFTWDGTKGRNVVYTTTSAQTVTLSTDMTLVPRGSIVRVYFLAASLNNITVQVGATTFVTLNAFQMAEFVFWVDDSGMSPTPHWIAVQKNLSCSQL